MRATIAIVLLQALLSSLMSSVLAVDRILYSGTVDEIKAALVANPSDIDARHPSTGQTPLMSAALQGRVDAVKFLLASGADHTIPEKDGYTPPHGAAFQGRPDVMSLLVRHGIDVATRHRDGFEPLHRACWGRQQRHLDTVKVLREEAKVDVLNAKSASGKTCLEMADPASPTYAYLVEIAGSKTDASGAGGDDL